MSFIYRVSFQVIHVPAILLVASLAWAQTPNPPGPSPTFVVAPFETDRTGWMPPPRLGETLAELLTARLAADGGVRVIDRSWLPGSRNLSSRTSESLFERVAGNGVDYVVLGSVTRLSIERHSSSRAGLLPIPVVAGLVRKQKTETVIGLTVRIVDVRTGEVVGTATSEGGGTHQSTSGGGLTVIGHLPVVGGTRSSATGFQDRLIDDAVQEAIGVVATEITAVAQEVDRGTRPAGGDAGPAAQGHRDRDRAEGADQTRSAGPGHRQRDGDHQRPVERDVHSTRGHRGAEGDGHGRSSPRNRAGLELAR